MVLKELRVDDLRQNAAWALVIALWICAGAAIRNDEQFLVAIVLLTFNFEIIKRGESRNSIVEYINVVLFHIVFYFFMKIFSLPLGRFRGEIVLFLEASFVALINVRFKFLSLQTMVRFLILGGLISSLFTLWQIVYVPRHAIRGFSYPLEFYRYWLQPIMMLLVTAPFLVTALAADLRAPRNGAARSAIADAYYFYSLPLLAFGLFPGVGYSHQANCDLNSTYIAIGGIVVLVLAGFMLSLATNRKSVAAASALASIVLGLNRCVQVPFTEIVVIVCGIMLVTWRWLPKGPARIE